MHVGNTDQVLRNSEAAAVLTSSTLKPRNPYIEVPVTSRENQAYERVQNRRSVSMTKPEVS